MIPLNNFNEKLKKVLHGHDLSFTESQELMNQIMNGNLDDAQIGGMLSALRAKVETSHEIAGFAENMRDQARTFDLDESYRPLVDTCGTGGDDVETINISTLTAIVAAGAGANVAKHGNRSVSSKCGSADLLEHLGVKLELTPDHVKRSIEDIGIGFMYAPAFHKSMKHAIGPRKSLGVRTVFNLLGPLTNPAGADRQLLGVFSDDWVRPVAEALNELGVDQALVVHGMDGMDEISASDRTVFAEVKDGSIESGEFIPEDLGVDRIDLADIEGGTPKQNVDVTERLLRGEAPEPVESIIAVNAGAVLYLADIEDSIKNGVEAARTAIHNDSARHKLEQLVEFTQSTSTE